MGEDELAVDMLIDLFSETILCKDGGCGKCVVCQKVEDKNHEDIFEPKNLKADGIREFVEKVYVKSVGDVKIMIIRALDKVDAKVQNFLLKSLEEPIEGVIFLLGVIRQSAVLDTIKSRSKKLSLSPFTKRQLTQFFDDNYIGLGEYWYVYRQAEEFGRRSGRLLSWVVV
jgi:DNA polymerase-3 subunit delta'